MLVSKQTVNTVSKFIDSCDNNSIYEINKFDELLNLSYILK